MQILLDSPTEGTRAVARPVAIWPIVALTVAALIGLAVGTAATADLPDSPSSPSMVQPSLTKSAV